MRYRTFASAVFCFCAAMAWTGAAEDARVAPEELPPTLTAPYRIQIGDELDVSFFKTTDLDREVTVGPDGDVYLPIIGRVRAAGQTLETLNEELTNRYGRELLSPQITVSIRDYASLRIYVGGAVREPGMIPFRGGVTAVQAVMEAGGFSQNARLKQVILIRQGRGNSPVGTEINMRQILRGGRFHDDVALAPSDVLFVPRTKISNLNRWIQQHFANNIPIPFGLGLAVDVTE